MTRLRRVLVPLAALWLSCQAGTTALVPVALWATAAESHAMECTCGHGADAMCPMHRHTPAGDPHGRCSIQASESRVAVLTAIGGAAGPMPTSSVSFVDPASSANVRPADAGAQGERPVPPDPPPPRASSRSL